MFLYIIYINIYVFVCERVFVEKDVYMYVKPDLYAQTAAMQYVSEEIYMYMCMCVCVYVCVCVRVCVWKKSYTCM